MSDLARAFTIAPISGDEADHLLVRSDEYMAALYPPESNHLVSSESLRSGDALFWGLFSQSARSVSSQTSAMDSLNSGGASVALRPAFTGITAMPKSKDYS